VEQPEKLRGNEAALELMRSLAPELIIVVAYGKILSQEVLDVPKYGCINVHASLLPKYRGAAPIQWAVLDGEHETGVTAMYMAQELDTGDIISTVRTRIGEDETAGELSVRLSDLGAELLSNTIRDISNGCVERKTQVHSEATYAPSLNKDMSAINWSETAAAIKCKVRGLNPWPVATAEFGGNVYKVFSVAVSNDRAGKRPGEIISTGERGIEVACADGSIFIRELQAPGGRRMHAAEFLRGHVLGVTGHQGSRTG